MRSNSRLKYSTLAALAAVVLLVGCSTPAPPPAPPPPPPAPPAVSLSNSVIRDAAMYETYVGKVGTMSAAFKSGADVAESLKFGDSYDPQALLRGEIAFAAVVALQDPNFVSNVRAFAVDPAARQQMTAALLADPNYAVAIRGSDSAAGLIISALLDRGQRLVNTGGSVKQAAYDIQHQDWSKEPIVNRDQRLADAKTGAMPASSEDEVSRLQAAAVGATPLPLNGQSMPAPYTPTVVRGLALAALAALGQAGDENAELLTPLMSDRSGTTCLNMAKLNLYQCLAVARPHYEDVFCLGQHVLADTGQCLMISAGAPAPVVAPLAISTTEMAYGAKPAVAKKKRRKS